MYAALRATSKTLVDYLTAYLGSGSDPLAVDFTEGSKTVSADTPKEMSERAEGLSAWLYRVIREDQTLNEPPRRQNDRLYPAPLPLRLHYLMTPIVGNDNNEGSSELEQLILGKAMQAMHDHPLFRGSDLKEEFVGTDVEFRARLETLPLDELAEVWRALDRSYQLSVSYEVSVIEIQSARAAERYAPVDQATIEGGVGIVVGSEQS
jgi:hypothetical protein